MEHFAGLWHSTQTSHRDRADLHDLKVLRVKIEDGYSDWFEVVTGARRGCFLSPLLFALAIDWCRNKQQKKRTYTEWRQKKLSDLDLADDTAEMSRNTQDLQTLGTEISDSASSTWPTVNAKTDQEHAHWDTSISIGYLHRPNRSKSGG